MFAMSTAEKIETVMLSRKSGACGTFVALDDGAARVDADGITVIVRGHRAGWSVRRGNVDAIDADLCTAARNAIEGI